MLARLLYAAVALCILGTRPEHAGTRPARQAVAAAPVAASSAADAAGIAPPPEFAVPRNSR